MNNNRVAYLITDGNITVNYQGQTHIIRRTGKLGDKLISAIKEGRLDEIPDLISAEKRITKQSKGAFTVENGKVLVNGVPAPDVLGNKIVRFSNEGLPFQPLLKFAENLQANPSYRSVNELFFFLEKNDHPITENGCFIAYKRINEDMTDIRTGTFDNSAGQVVKMPRNQVDEDSSRTCSSGLHVSNWNYAHQHYHSGTGVLIEVEVNPADVVAVPSDYNESKMRVCSYKVLGIVSQPFEPEEVFRQVDADYQEEIEEVEEDSCGSFTDTNSGLCGNCQQYCVDCDEELSADDLVLGNGKCENCQGTCDKCYTKLTDAEAQFGDGICDECANEKIE